jgi:threonine dehydratase
MSFELPTLTQIDEAATLVYRHLPPTPQYRWPLLDAAVGTETWVKHENHTPVGAFKLRGGLVYMECLLRTRPEVKGVVAATRGNHGQSIGFAARLAGLPAVIVVPHGNSREKNRAMLALGAELIEHGEDFQAASEFAEQLAAERGLVKVPSFDALLVRGVATYGLEFLRGAPALDTVFVPIGMGSGICGMMAARDALGLKTKIVGVVSAGAPATLLSYAAGRKIEHAVTTVIADGLSCRTPSDDALGAILAGVERIVAVDDAQVASAMRLLFQATHNVAEGAGAAALAAVIAERESLRGKRIGIVLSGGNVDADVFAGALASQVA